MGLTDDLKKAIPPDLEEKARDVGASTKAAATDVGELASSAVDAAAEAFDRGEQSFRAARADGKGVTAAVKEAGRGAFDASGDPSPAAEATESPEPPASA